MHPFAEHFTVNLPKRQRNTELLQIEPLAKVSQNWAENLGSRLDSRWRLQAA
jgi:hypothetical protein